MSTTPTAIEQFDPNNQKAAYATYVPYRYNGPSFKSHAQRGHASSAFKNHSDCVIYKQVDGRWVEQARKDSARRPLNCEMCGTEVTGERHVWDSTLSAQVKKVVWTAECRLLRDERGKLRDPMQSMWLCFSCASDNA